MDLYKENLQKYFDNVSKIAPQYFITTSSFQDECFKQIDSVADFTTKTQVALVKNLRTLNENFNSYVDLNKTMITNWVNTLTKE